MTASRSTALFLVLLMIGSVVVFLAPASVGQDGGSAGDVPVPYRTAEDQIDLHLWRHEGTLAPPEGADDDLADPPTGQDCPDEPISDQQTQAACSLRFQQPPGTNPPSPNGERYLVARDVEGTPAPASIARFTLDTNTEDWSRQAANFPFTIKKGDNAVQVQFFYRSDANCVENVFGEDVGQPLNFTITIGRTSSGAPASDAVQRLESITVRECNPATGELSNQANRVSTAIPFKQDRSFNRGQYLVLEIFAENVGQVGTGLTWDLLFEDATYNSKVTVRTPQAVEAAVWASDAGGTHRTNFNPDAGNEERFMVANLALRSPFGPQVIPRSGIDGQIQNPDGALVDLKTGESNPSNPGVTSVALAERTTLREGVPGALGAGRVFEFDQPSNFDDQPWHYEQGAVAGSYKINVEAPVLGKHLTFTTNVAMGSFAFTLEMVEGETKNHLFKRGTSTTFLLVLTNPASASTTDSYKLSTSFQFSSRDLTWSATLLGLEANNRVTLDPGETALLQVKLTPPDNARTGDRARIDVTARSEGSTGTQSITLEGEITDQTIRKTGILVLEDPFTVGIGTDTRIETYVWNRGTAVDSFTVNIVEGSASLGPDRFDPKLLQTRFDGVTPGAVETVPIRITTADNLEASATFNFELQATSQNQPEATSGPVTINVNVASQRGFDFFALNGANDKARTSLRYGKMNMSGGDNPATPFSEDCEDQSGHDPAFCRAYTSIALHRFTIRNTGDVVETLTLDHTAPTYRNSGACDRVLADRIESVTIIPRVNFANPMGPSAVDEITVAPGETKRFYLRVAYDGNATNNVFNPSPTSQGPCTWEEQVLGVKAIPEAGTGLNARTIETTTRVYSVEELGDLPQRARGFLDLSERSVPDPSNQVVKGLPDRTGLTPGEKTLINFTLNLQDGHEDQITVRMGDQESLEGLRDEGWVVELQPGPGLSESQIDVRDNGALVIPSNATQEADQTRAIGHASGEDYVLQLAVTPPTEGLEENQRETFVVFAQSQSRSSATDTLGIDVQIGQDFAFEVDPGQVTTIEAHAGDTVAFGLTIHNTGASRDTYDITATTETLGDVTVQPSSVTISPLSSKSVSIQIPVPEGTTQGLHTVNAVVSTEANPDDPDDDLTSDPVTYEVDVKPEGDLDMTFPENTVAVGPGGSASINYTITNAGADAKDLEITELFAPPGWSTSLSDGGLDTRTVPGDGSVSYTYLVEAPENIVEGSRYVFVVRADDTGPGNDFANGVAFAVVQSQAAVELTAEDQRKVIDRGETTRFNVTVRNLGTGPTWYNLQTQFQSQRWSADILDQEGALIENSTVRVPEKTFKRVQVQVQAPNTVTKGHVEEIRLTATAVGQPDTSDRVTLRAPIHDFDISVAVDGPAVKDAAPGDNTEYLLSVTNNGNGEDSISFSFEAPDGGDPVYDVETDLTGDTTPPLKAGETLTDIRVIVRVPSPNQGPVPTPNGVSTVIRATSSGQVEGSSPTVSTQVTTKLVPYVRLDVDGDNAFELALDRNRNSNDGFEVFVDKDQVMADRGEISASDGITSEGLFTLDGDGDGLTDHLVDTDGDGIANLYFDPDRAQTSQVPYTVDINNDGQPETPIDADFDGLIDGLYDARADVIYPALNLDFSGDGRRDLLIDTDQDGVYDTFVDPNEDPPIITSVTKDGDRYELDTNGDGKVDTYYNAKTQSITDATTTNLQDFLKDYWYFVALFALVLVLFVVIVVRRT